MSDILIRGMEMRERCNDQDGHWSCPFFGSVYPHGFFCKGTTKEIDNPFSKQPDCPLIPVPPHGRLIDADALKEAMARMVPWAIVDPTANAFLDGLSAAYEAIQAAPTIIPAEEGET